MERSSLELWESYISNKSSNSQKLYRLQLMKFLRWLKEKYNMTADDLRLLKYKEDTSAKPWERCETETIVREYLAHLDSENVLATSKKVVLSVINSFFLANGLRLSLRKNEVPDSDPVKASRVPTREEIRQIIDAADNLRDRALMLFLKDSGLRVSDVVTLKWKDLKPYGEDFLGFKILTAKKNCEARGFVGKETVDVLKIYRSMRVKGYGDVPPEADIDNHYVFCQVGDGTKPLKAIWVSAMLNKHIRALGFNDLTIHGFRKFWEQNVKASRPEYVAQLNGRKLSKNQKAYWYLTDIQLFELYKSNYDNLRVYIEKKILTPEDARSFLAGILSTNEGKQLLLEFIHKDDSLKAMIQAEAMTAAMKAIETFFETLRKTTTTTESDLFNIVKSMMAKAQAQT